MGQAFAKEAGEKVPDLKAKRETSFLPSVRPNPYFPFDHDKRSTGKSRKGYLFFWT